MTDCVSLKVELPVTACLSWTHRDAHACLIAIIHASPERKKVHFVDSARGCEPGSTVEHQEPFLIVSPCFFKIFLSWSVQCQGLACPTRGLPSLQRPYYNGGPHVVVQIITKSFVKPYGCWEKKKLFQRCFDYI